jgi:hypothetical protein
VVNYNQMKLTLKAEGLATRLRGKMVEVYDFPGGRLEVRWKGQPLPHSTFDKLQRVRTRNRLRRRHVNRENAPPGTRELRRNGSWAYSSYSRR